MEDVGAQVAPPVFIHQTLGVGGGRFYETHHHNTPPRKRTLAYPHQYNHNQGPLHHHQPPQQQQQQQQQRFPSPLDNWNPKVWDWDSVRFVAKPLESDVLHPGGGGGSGGGGASVQSKSENEHGVHMMLKQQEQQKKKNHMEEDEEDNTDDQSLRLQLGGGSGSTSVSVEEPVSSARPNKRVRSGSPGGTNYPMCQVDNCKEDLSNAKDYHRRHKVCEVHSKSTKAIVGKQMQRFCQQCSRFHPLSEFDEGKRSCRRRLAGHNRRRRKTQPEDVTSRSLLPSNYEQAGSGNLDIINLLAILARAQGVNDGKGANFSSAPNKDQLIQILSKINSLPLPADFVAKLCMSGSLNRNNLERTSADAHNILKGDASSSSTMDLLAVLSAKLAASDPDALSILSQRNTENIAAEKSKVAGPNQDTGPKMFKQHNLELPSIGGESSTSYQSPDSDSQVQQTRAKPLQLFSFSAGNDSPPNLPSTRKYFSSDSSNRTEERSPSASPPVVQKLFPMQTSRETGNSGTMLISRPSNADNRDNKTRECITSLELFGGAKKGAATSSVQGFPHQAGYTSSSGSDYSPSSLNSDAQDRTGRIIFKLFDKDPSHLPMTLRMQIYNWLSHCPSEMESYIRPGCVVLTIYLSMSSSAWDQLEENLLQRVNSLIQDSESDFWRNGRFLIHTGRQLVSHKDGKIRHCKSWRTWTSPELISVSPLAVVRGEETALLLRGRNLYNAGAKIHCTHIGGYISKEAPFSVRQGTVYDEISLDVSKLHDALSSKLGRYFIEVENGFRGTSFPVIIADAPICKELRLLEPEFDEVVAKENDTISRHDFVQPRSREVVMHFLNELGWLFQRRTISSTLEGPDFKLGRFKFLFVFSVERNYCAVVNTLLNILVETNLGVDGGLSSESLGMLSEVHLLNRAVKRRCRDMVDLLLHYAVHNRDASKIYIFPPNLCGRDGVTPLHLAASTSNSDELIDALTSDPLEIGLRSWSTLVDANGMSPFAYASMTNNHSYNGLVARKLAGRTSEVSVSVSIGNEVELQHYTADKNKNGGSRSSSQLRQGQNSCSKCVVAARRYNTRISSGGSQGLLQRPFIHSMLAIAAVCVCVCLFLRGAPDIGLVAPFKWENLEYGPI